MDIVLFVLIPIAVIALIVILYLLLRRHRKTPMVSIVRPFLDLLQNAMNHKKGQWRQCTGEKDPRIDTDREIGTFAFTAADGSISALYRSESANASLQIFLADGGETEIAFTGGIPSAIHCHGENFDDTHWEVRYHGPTLRKMRNKIRFAVGFTLTREDDEVAPKEFAQPTTKKQLDYGREANRPKKKRKKRAPDIGE